MRYSVRSTAGISWHVFKDIGLLLSALLFSCQGTEQELKRLMFSDNEISPTLRKGVVLFPPLICPYIYYNTKYSGFV